MAFSAIPFLVKNNTEGLFQNTYLSLPKSRYYCVSEHESIARESMHLLLVNPRIYCSQMCTSIIRGTMS